MLAIADACPENDLFDARTVHLQGFFDRDERHEIAMAFKHISNPLTNGQGVAVDRGVGDECCGHGAWTEVLYSQLAQIGCASWLVLALRFTGQVRKALGGLPGGDPGAKETSFPFL